MLPAHRRQIEAEFDAICRQRLEAGEVEYGGEGFRRSAIRNVDEAIEEVADVRNYALMMYARLVDLRRRLEGLEGIIHDSENQAPIGGS